MNNPTEISKFVAEIKDSPDYWEEMVRLDFTRVLDEVQRTQKLTQKQLAAQLGVSPQYINSVLSGNKKCSLSQMVRLMFRMGRRLRFYSTPLEDRPVAEQAEQLARMLEEFAVSVRTASN